MKKVIEIGSFEAKNQLSSLLRQAEKGQRIYITRRGVRVAVLVGIQDSLAGESQGTPPDELLSRLRAFRRTAKRGPESLERLIEEGRR
jgi:prevent-host-death family protein